MTVVLPSFGKDSFEILPRLNLRCGPLSISPLALQSRVFIYLSMREPSSPEPRATAAEGDGNLRDLAHWGANPPSRAHSCPRLPRWHAPRGRLRAGRVVLAGMWLGYSVGMGPTLVVFRESSDVRQGNHRVVRWERRDPRPSHGPREQPVWKDLDRRAVLFKIEPSDPTPPLPSSRNHLVAMN